MSSIIKIKRSSTKDAVPGSLEVGEIAVNLFDRKLYVGNSAGVTAIGGEDFRLTTQSAGSEGAYLKLLGDSVLSTNTVFIQAGEGVDVTRQSNGTITIAAEDASAANKGVASFDSTNFTVSSGAVSTNDLTLNGDSGSAAATIGESMTIAGTDAQGIDTSATGTTVTITAKNASDTQKGVASFDSGDFSVSSGAVTLADSSSGAVLAISGTADEVDVSRSNGTVTVGLPNDVTIGNNLTVSNDLGVAGNVTIDGNLTVEGGVTYISSSTVNVDDTMIKLSANNAGDSVDHGVYAKYVDGVTTKYAGYFRDSSDSSVFKFYTGLQTEPTTTVDTGATGYTLAQVDAIIDGGTY